MGVRHEYFVLDNDEQCAALLEPFDDGILGVEAATELVSLEALLLGLQPLLESTLTLMDRLDHAVTIATDADDPAEVSTVITKVADHTTALIAQATPEQLAAAMQPWSETEEFAGYVSAQDLAEMIDGLMPLFRQAVTHGRRIYVRTTC